jgi:hypothetical protein
MNFRYIILTLLLCVGFFLPWSGYGENVLAGHLTVDENAVRGGAFSYPDTGRTQGEDLRPSPGVGAGMEVPAGEGSSLESCLKSCKDAICQGTCVSGAARGNQP